MSCKTQEDHEKHLRKMLQALRKERLSRKVERMRVLVGTYNIYGTHCFRRWNFNRSQKGISIQRLAYSQVSEGSEKFSRVRWILLEICAESLEDSKTSNQINAEGREVYLE